MSGEERPVSMQKRLRALSAEDMEHPAVAPIVGMAALALERLELGGEAESLENTRWVRPVVLAASAAVRKGTGERE